VTSQAGSHFILHHIKQYENKKAVKRKLSKEQPFWKHWGIREKLKVTNHLKTLEENSFTFWD
jgi:hypothetical protein